MSGVPIRLEEFGCIAWVEGDTIYSVEAGEFELYGICDEVTVEVTAPEGAFLDRLNSELGTHFALGDFPGR